MPQTAGAPSTPAAQAAAARLAGLAPPPRPGAPAAAAEPLSKKEARKAKKEAAEGEGKKKKPVKPIAAVLLLLVVGYVVKGKVVKPHYGPGAKVPPGAVVALPSVTTNLSDGHLAQVSISIQLTKAANAKLVANDQSEMVANIVTDLGRQTYSGLIVPAGRARLQAALLHTFQAELGPSEGAQQVSAVYFTGFVLQ